MLLIASEHGMCLIARKMWEVMGARNVYIIKACWWNIHNFLILTHIIFFLEFQQGNQIIFQNFQLWFLKIIFFQTCYFGIVIYVCTIYNIWLSCIGGIPCVFLTFKINCKRCGHFWIQNITGINALVMCGHLLQWSFKKIKHHHD
jgi:hypothetical protein